MHARVVGAVIMRDLQTRFGAGYFGFLLGLLMPLGHLGIVITVSTLIQHASPIGTDRPIFLMTGVLPFIIWLYSHRQIMTTLSYNRPLLFFPGVDIFDLFLSRIVIELLNSTIIVIVVISAMTIVGYDVHAYKWPDFIYGLILAWALGLGTGLFFGSLTSIMPLAIMFGLILGPLMWATSGIFFLPDGLPESLQKILYFNPLSHVVDGVRLSYFSEYSSDFFNSTFLYIFIVSAIAVSLALTAAIRRVA
ncbi:ABC-2 type transporter [Xanthobacter versatilis]|uniref:ABC-2 type transporter n=1 Tax=Xanthobacter autotrophicus (strain ATCC BAA-1158 / Py2) TaxID=78245 RepID=A7ILZ2_XANP2|nr:ABC-2 type transporter [Xanthobacter autotrophicus Py2]